MKALLVALNSQYMHTNLAVRLLKAAAQELPGWQVEVCEKHINLPWRQVMEEIGQAGADLIAFSCYIWNIDYVKKLCRALDLACPGAVIALGGPEVSFDAENLLREEKSVDCVMCGEGEAAIVPLLRACAGEADFSRVPGLCWRQGEKVVQNACAAPVPPESWPDVYAQGAQELSGRIVYVETSRGCPYGCRYCLSSRDRVRALGLEESVRRLTHLAESGVKLIKLVDRTFNFDRSRAYAIWQALIDHAEKNGVDCTYHFEIAANLMDERDWALLAGAPDHLFQFEAGIQSSSDEVLREVGRSVRFEPLKASLARLAQLPNVHLHVDLIAGLPREGLERFGKSFDDAWELGAQQLQLGFLKLLKGSGLREDAEKYGIRYEPDAPYEVISTQDISFAELCFLKDVETVLNWYANSHRYDNAIRLLLMGRRPFELFSELARRFRASGVLDAERGEKARAQALYDHASALCDRELLGELIRHDLMKQGRRRDLPAELTFEENAEQRAALRERYHPVRGQAVYDGEYDLAAFEERGEIVRRPTRTFYHPTGTAARG